MIGQRVSHYQILEMLGQGGMGEVYLAEDTTLDRKVALKFLPEIYTKDPGVTARFQREAKAAAALNHPNLITVYEIGQHDGRAYISMEYVRGATLREVLDNAEADPISVDRAIDILSQVCDGMARAHAAGIVHRDLKPENIVIEPDGNAKILDFGLAQVSGKTRLTAEQSTMGTLFYMAPEQLKGVDIDHRADIWAIGVMLYEMVAGKLPFDGEYEQAVTYAIVHSEPEPLVAGGIEAPDDMQTVVDKVLAKDRDERYQQIADFKNDLHRIRERKAVSAKRPKSQSRWRSAGWKIAAVTAIAAGAIVAGLKVFEPLDQPAVTSTHKQVTFVGDATRPAISPDGQFIAYATDSQGEDKVVVQDLGGGTPLAVSGEASLYPHTEVGTLAWKPNGVELTFPGILDGRFATIIVPRLGGQIRQKPLKNHYSWSPDGSYVASAAMMWQSMDIENDDGGLSSEIDISGQFNWLRGLEWSPRSDRLLYLTESDEEFTIWSIEITGNEKQVIVKSSVRLSSARWAANGRAIYYFRAAGRGKDLMKVAISTETGGAAGDPRVLIPGLEAGDLFSISADNKRLAYARHHRYSNLWLVRFDEQGAALRPVQLTQGTHSNFTPMFSPAGDLIAFAAAGGPHSNIFVIPADGGTARQVTFGRSHSTSPVWSRDGSQLAFGSMDLEGANVWTVSTDGGTPRPYLKTQMSTDTWSLTWAPGSDILYHSPGHRNFRVLDPGSEEERPLLHHESEGWAFSPALSPDGKTTAVFRNVVADEFKFERQGLWTISSVDASMNFVRKGQLMPIVWSDDGKSIYALSMSKMPFEVFKVATDGSSAEHYYTLPVENIEMLSKIIDMTPDGRKLVYPAVTVTSDVWMIEHFDPENELESPLRAPEFPGYKQLAYLENANNMMRQRNFAKSEEILRQGLALNQNNVHLLVLLGKTHQARGSTDDAYEIYQRALALAPDHTGILFGLSQTAFLRKRYAEAKEFNRRYLSVPRLGAAPPAPALSNLAAIAIIDQDYADAERHLRKALKADSTFSPALAHLAYLQTEQGRFADALQSSRLALSIDSTFYSINLLAWVLVAGNINADEGIHKAKQAMASKPANWAQYAAAYTYFAVPEHTIGLGLLKQNDPANAVNVLERASKLYPDRQAIRDDLAAAQQMMLKRRNN